jgi:DNA-binding response OmpR family regulator
MCVHLRWRHARGRGRRRTPHGRARRLITGYLGEFDVRATGAHDGPSGLHAARQADVDAVVLDLMLPGMSGTVAERVAGLEAGADDYLVKPFALEELYARLRAIRRREPDGDRLVFGDVAVDPGDRRVWVTEQDVAMARREFDMLSSLMSTRWCRALGPLQLRAECSRP